MDIPKSSLVQVQIAQAQGKTFPIWSLAVVYFWA
jgi:hypothetical protein